MEVDSGVIKAGSLLGARKGPDHIDWPTDVLLFLLRDVGAGGEGNGNTRCVKRHCGGLPDASTASRCAPVHPWPIRDGADARPRTGWAGAGSNP